jgi:putative membrane protein
MTLMMLAFWAMLVLGGLVLYRALRHDAARSTRSDDATRLLDERFARGEIDADEYRVRRDLLRSS